MTFIQAYHHSAGSNLTPTRVVIHSTCPEMGYPKASAAGKAVSTARYFQSSGSGGSAHYVVDVAETVQCLAENVIAWHAPPNGKSLGVEICSDGGSKTSFRNPKVAYTRAQWLSPQVWPAVLRAARLTRQLCDKYDIPVTKLSASDLKAGREGICGHVDVSNAWHQSDHDDPGPDFPWPEFMAAVKSGATDNGGYDVISDQDIQRIAAAVHSQKIGRTGVSFGVLGEKLLKGQIQTGLVESGMQRIWTMLLQIDRGGIITWNVRKIAAKLGGSK